MHPGYIGAIVGGGFGLLGGIIGCWFSIKNARPGPQRCFMINMVWWFWLAALGLAIVVMLVPGPYRFIVIPAFSMILPLWIRWGNKRLKAMEQSDNRKDQGD